jgi:hypothetical protein
VVAGPAAAWRSNHFVSPRRNIACRYLTAADGKGLIYCETRNDGFEVGLLDDGQRGFVNYHGGAPQGPYSFWRPVLGYGDVWESPRGTIRCRSRFTGMSCYHGRHGFFISRRSYDVW